MSVRLEHGMSFINPPIYQLNMRQPAASVGAGTFWLLGRPDPKNAGFTVFPLGHVKVLGIVVVEFT